LCPLKGSYMAEQLIELQGEESTTAVSYNICQTIDLPDFKTYRAICACQSSEHDQSLAVEFDKELNCTTVTIYYTASTAELGSSNDYFRKMWMTNNNWFISQYALVGWWFTDMYNRFKYALKILYSGRIELENSYLMDEKEHIKSYLNALNSALSNIDNSGCNK